MWIGVDVGGSGFRAGLVDEDGNVSTIVRVAHDGVLDVVSVCDRVARAIGEWTASGAVDGVGLGVAAWVTRDSGVVVSAPNLPWENVDVAAMMTARVEVPVRVVNDLKAIAWGEYRFGAGRGARTMMAVFVGTGVGSAVVEEERVITGAEGFAGEIGHVSAGPSDGPLCGCGMRGCLETYVGARALLAGEHEDLSAMDGRAQQGDRVTRARLTDAGERLGRVVAGALMLANPDVLVWGGGVWGGSSILREAAMKALSTTVHPARWKTLRICESSLGEAAGIVGAADLTRSPPRKE